MQKEENTNNPVRETEEVKDVLTSPLQRMRNTLVREQAKERQRAKDAVGLIFRKNWEKRILREVKGAKFCAHIHDERTGTTKMWVHVRNASGGMDKIPYEMGYTDELDDLTQNDYLAILKELTTKAYEQRKFSERVVR